MGISTVVDKNFIKDLVGEKQKCSDYKIHKGIWKLFIINNNHIKNVANIYNFIKNHAKRLTKHYFEHTIIVQ